MTTTDVQDRMYDLHAGLTPNQRALLFVEQVRRSRNSTQLFLKERAGPLQNSAMARACTNLYGGVEQGGDCYGAMDRRRSQDQVRRDVVTLVRMIRLVNEGLESALHEIGMRAAAVVRMLQTAGLRAGKDGRFTNYLNYRAFVEEAGRIRTSLCELLKRAYTEQAVVEAISEKYFYGKPILFREKERQLARTTTWLLVAIDEYNALVPQKIDSGESCDSRAVDSNSNAEVTVTLESLDPETIRAAALGEDREQQIRVVEVSAGYLAMSALGESLAPPIF